jgi:ABC-type transporter Mla MlaB component
MPPPEDLWPPPGPRSTVIVVQEPLAGEAAVQALCERVRTALSRGETEVVTCDLSAIRQVDVGAVDALARAHLTARRLGGAVRLRAAPRELQELLAFVGLAGVVLLGGRPSSGRPACGGLPGGGLPLEVGR